MVSLHIRILKHSWLCWRHTDSYLSSLYSCWLRKVSLLMPCNHCVWKQFAFRCPALPKAESHVYCRGLQSSFICNYLLPSISCSTACLQLQMLWDRTVPTSFQQIYRASPQTNWPYNISHLASTRMSCKHEKINGNFVKSCSVNPKRESRPGFISAACICVGLQIITLKSQVGHVVCL